MTLPIQNRPSPATRVALPLLLLLSGFCGISYEILYTKLLGNLLGSQFTINATVLLTFLLGIGMGTLYAHRFAGYLWAIEGAIGLYAALLAGFYESIDRLLYTRIPLLGTNLLAAAGVSFILLLVPAFLIGCSVPLFARYLTALRAADVFSWTYGVYNVGAALTALGMEFVLLRALGLRATTFALALLNLTVAAGLLLLTRGSALVPDVPRDRVRFPPRTLAALALASVASAVFQLMMIKVAEFIFGPYNETFSLVLATVLLGISAGALVTGRFGLGFGGALLLSLVGLAWLLAVFPAATSLYALLYPSMAVSYPLLVLLKFLLVLVLMGLPAVGFGATIPALLGSYRDVARESGQLLFCSSIANALGFLLMAFVLHRYLDYGPLILALAIATASALLLRSGWRATSGRLAILLVGLSFVLHAGSWDETLLYVGHKSFHSPETLERERRDRLLADRFKGPQDVFAIVWKRGKPYFFINGYVSIPLSSTSEKLVGALSAMLAPRLDEALVLGMGSGGTAGTVALLYEHTDVVEINRVVLQNLYRMKEYNFDIENRPRIRVIHDDGIHFVKTSPKRYSLILNTVTTPLYFSSSKLYTREFYRHVANRLTDDGLYVTWVDGRIGDRGIDIILETLDDTFEHCWQTYMKSNYYIMACSQQEIGLRQYEAVSANAELRSYLAQEHSTPIRLLPYSVISTDAMRFRSSGPIPVNTLDDPVLEFEMARLPPDSRQLKGYKERLRLDLDLYSVEAALGSSMDWDPAEFLLYSDLRTSSRSSLATMLSQHVSAAFGDVFDAYELRARELAGEIGTARGFLAFGERLNRHGRHGGAQGLVSRALTLDPQLSGAHYELAVAAYALAQYEQCLVHLDLEWELRRYDRVPLFRARALIRLQRFDEALLWLDTAASVGEKTDKIAYYRGRCYEGLGDPERAESSYREALAADPSHDRARAELDRLTEVDDR